MKMISKLNDIKINMNELLFYLLKFKTYLWLFAINLAKKLIKTENKLN